MLQTFSTPANLYAEQVADIAAGGTGNFGPTVTIAGVTWTWDVHYYVETAPGSPSNPFTSTAERTAWATANLSRLRSGVSTVWGPGAVEYRFVGPGPEDFSAITSADPYPVATGSLSSILSSVPAAGTVAAPNDVFGGRLQSDGAAWRGFIGCLTVAQADAFDATNVGVGSWYHLINTDGTTTPTYINQ